MKKRCHLSRGRSELLALAGAILLLATALLLVGEQRAISQDEAVVATPTSLTVSEPSSSATFQVSLANEPTNAVSIPLSFSGGCTASPTFIGLNPANWDEPQTVIVQAVDDAIADGPEVCLVSLGPTSSDDLGYVGLFAYVTVTVHDDEEGVLVAPTDLTVREPNGSETFTVTLTNAPAYSVTIPLSATGACTVWPSSIVLTSSTWATGQAAIVTAQDDDIVDGPETCVVESGPTASTDVNYQNLYGEDVIVTVEDDEGIILVAPTDLTVWEPNDSETFTVTLANAPAYLVTIPLSTTGPCTVWPSSIILTPSTWATGQAAIVTAQDDDIVDGPETCVVKSGPTASSDVNYQNLYGEDVIVTVEDDDQAGVTAMPLTLTVWEPSSFDTYHVTLTSQPVADVTILVSAGNGQCKVSPSSISLGPDTWAIGRAITVTALDDFVDDDGMTCPVQTGPTASSDDNYIGLYAQIVTVTVEDNDEAGVTAMPSTLTVEEPDGLDTYHVTLDSQPVADVTILVSAGNNQCKVSSPSISLGPDTWAIGRTITVTALDDFVDDGDMTCPVQTGPTDSSDGNYIGLYAGVVTVTVEDDDQAGVFAEPLSLTVTEGVDLETFVVRLGSEPESPVLIPLGASGGECYTLLPSIVLTEANWFAGLEVPVAAVDDLVADGDTTCPVEVGPPSSDDGNYDVPEVITVTVTVEDNDEAAVSISDTSLNVSEPSTSDTFAVRLTSEPKADVTIGLVAEGECTVSPGSITLNSTNWATWQTAVVTAVDDDVADGDTICTIHTTVTSGDDNYDGFDLSDVTVTVADEDELGIRVDPWTLEVSEPSGSDVFTLTLASQPLAPVDIPLSTSNDECSVWPMTATLDISNWSTGTVAIVTAEDDYVVDGDLMCLVQTGESESEDTNYAGRNPRDVTVTVRDNDVAQVLIAPPELTVREAADTGTFVVSLASEPAYSVFVPLQASGGECTISRSFVWLTKDNWSMGVETTVTAFDDHVVDGDTTCLVEIGPPSSDDDNYGNITEVGYVTVTVEDNDVAAVTISTTSLNISEPSGSGSFVVRLTSQPADPVTISLTESNEECWVWPESLALGALNWTTGATATVTAVDDDVADGPQTCVIYTTVSSKDDDYRGFPLDDVIVTVSDDEGERWLAYLPLVLRDWPPLPDTPVLHSISNSEGLGMYTVAWDAASRADTYVLEEATTATFAASWQVYAGAVTSYLISGRDAGRYYYRVKARNIWGDSGWSNVERVDVLWELEPNDDALTQANGPVISGLTYYGTFLDQSDPKDYFYFDLLVPHAVRLTLSNIAFGQDYNLVLRNASLVDVGYSGELGTTPEQIQTGTLPAGRYYIQIYRVSGEGSEQPYHLWLVYE